MELVKINSSGTTKHNCSCGPMKPCCIGDKRPTDYEYALMSKNVYDGEKFVIDTELENRG
jgi:hypothetical protein